MKHWKCYFSSFFFLATLSANATTPKSQGAPAESSAQSPTLSAPAATAKKENWFYRNFTVSAGTTLTSDYVWRGVSQSNHNPAIQGEFKLKSISGIYASIWGSNVKFLDENDDTATIELDYTLGYETEVHGVGINAGILRYVYPQTWGLDYTEFFAGLSYKIAYVSVAYSDNVFDSRHSGTYYLAGLEYELPIKFPGFSIGAHAGYYDLNGPDFGKNSYVDFGAYIQKAFQHFTIKLAWTDTNNDFDAGGLDASRIVISASASIG